jgi:hypothetical protein
MFARAASLMLAGMLCASAGVHAEGDGQQKLKSQLSGLISGYIGGSVLADIKDEATACYLDALVRDIPEPDAGRIAGMYAGKVPPNESLNRKWVIIEGNPSRRTQLEARLREICPDISGRLTKMSNSIGAATPEDEASESLERKDYATALALFEPLAKSGDPYAQNSLGTMYAQGEGVQQDDQTAVYWFSQAAAQGHGEAQWNLAMMLYQGLGVPRDIPKAYFWLAIAAGRGDEDSKRDREAIKPELTADQIREAERLASEWRPS